MFGNRDKKIIKETENHTKKKTKRYREQRPEQVEAYQAQIGEIPTQRIAYVDETGIDTCLYREYGWSKRGERVMGIVSGRKYKRTGIVAAQMQKTILAPLQYDGAIDSVFFEKWFETCLLPVLPKQSYVVMDNASFHRKNRLHALAEKAGHRVIFLPPYSPELNPIENFWSWLKRHLRNVLPVHSTLDDALCSVFQAL